MLLENSKYQEYVIREFKESGNCYYIFQNLRIESSESSTYQDFVVIKFKIIG